MKTGYNEFILQSVESDEEMLSNEWKSLKWEYFKHSIFKIQKRIFKAEKEGNYRKVNRLSRLLVNDKRSLLYAINVVTKMSLHPAYDDKWTFTDPNTDCQVDMHWIKIKYSRLIKYKATPYDDTYEEYLTNRYGITPYEYLYR